MSDKGDETQCFPGREE